MSVHREVVSLSQLLRRTTDSSIARQHRTGHKPPPLAFQPSRQRPAKAQRTAERPNIGHSPLVSCALAADEPLSFTDCVRGASAASASQSESTRSSSVFAPLSQEGDGEEGAAVDGHERLVLRSFETEGEQWSALTSMSQSSVSQLPSQNWLASSQEGSQPWRAPELLPPPPAPPCCMQRRELEQCIGKAIAQQTLEQKEQQQQLLTDVASPIAKSVDEIKTQLESCSEAQQKHDAVIAGLAADMKEVTAAVSALREQSCSDRTAVCQEIRTAVTSETAGVKAVLTSLQARVETVAGSVKSCSGLVAQLREDAGTKYDVLLSAVAASSCTCTQEVAPIDAHVNDERESRKRKWTAEAHEQDASGGYTLAALLGSPVFQSPARCRDNDDDDIDDEVRRDKGTSETSSSSLQGALQQIEALRARRRSILQEW